MSYKVDGSGRLHDQIAIVTGSSSGIGRGIALALAREGAVVIHSDLKEQAAPHGFEPDIDTPTHQVIVNNKGRSVFKKCDMGKTEEITALIDFAVKVDSPSFPQPTHRPAEREKLTSIRPMANSIFSSTMQGCGSH